MHQKTRVREREREWGTEERGWGMEERERGWGMEERGWGTEEREREGEKDTRNKVHIYLDYHGKQMRTFCIFWEVMWFTMTFTSVLFFLLFFFIISTFSIPTRQYLSKLWMTLFKGVQTLSFSIRRKLADPIHPKILRRLWGGRAWEQRVGEGIGGGGRWVFWCLMTKHWHLTPAVWLVQKGL